MLQGLLTWPLPCDSLAGDYGFDPMGLGADPEDLKWFVEAEIQHARWAMLGMLGIVGPELMEKQGRSAMEASHSLNRLDRCDCS